MKISYKLKDREDSLNDSKGNYCIRCNGMSVKIKTIKTKNKTESIFRCSLCRLTVSSNDNVEGA